MTVAEPSLFDRPAQPVIQGASAWIESLIGGSLATSLCVIAVAILGLLLLTGRLRIRRSVEVVLGCFLLLGAGVTATQLQQLSQGIVGQGSGNKELVTPQAPPAKPPPPANYDPYAGASLRQD